MPFRHAFVALLSIGPCIAAAEIQYTLAPVPSSREVEVTIQVDQSLPLQQFEIPAWCPGFYFLENFQNKIEKVSAADRNNNPLAVSHPEARTWTVNNSTGGPLTLRYRVNGDDPGLGFFGANVQGDKAFVNGASTFMYLPGRTQERDTLSIQVPKKWLIATAMDRDDHGLYFSSTGYDEFIDHPIQMGTFTLKTFKVGDIPFQAVYVSPDGHFEANLASETENLKAGCEAAIAMFGGAPFKGYTFFFHYSVGDFDGGLEHRASCVLALPNQDEPVDDLVEHEFFHAWNVKQIRPKPLGPFDYTKPNRTHNLWFAEGVTDYYSKLLTYRAGLANEDWLFKQFGEQIAELQQSKTKLLKTLDAASWEAWENGGFGVGDLSFYTKGFLVGLVLDAQIRSITKGAKSLDDVMRYLYSTYRLPHPGYGEDDLLAAINTVADHDFTELYTLMTRSTEELPYGLLSGIGLRARRNSEAALGQPDYIVERDSNATRNQQHLLADYLKSHFSPDDGTTRAGIK